MDIYIGEGEEGSEGDVNAIAENDGMEGRRVWVCFECLTWYTCLCLDTDCCQEECGCDASKRDETHVDCVLTNIHFLIS